LFGGRTPNARELKETVTTDPYNEPPVHNGAKEFHGFLRGRLTPPTYRVALLPTPALIRLQNEGADYKVVLLIAPAGYGKTALLAQWRDTLRASGTHTSWMSITGDQQEAAQLLAYLATSLIEAGINLGAVEKQAEQWFADVPIASAISALTTQLARNTHPIILLIDDVHQLPRATVELIFGPLLQPGLSHVHVAMSGRSRPALPLAGLRSRGELLEFEIDALRFGAAEIDTMFPDLTPTQRELLNKRTEGWPVALQLARLWITAKPERVELIAGFSGRTFEVAEYLTEQVLSDLPPSVRGTLESTAPLDQLCAGLVEAVTESPDAWHCLISLPSVASLIVPLDKGREWYRLHPLLADYLKDQLRQHNPAVARTCNTRASVWFESREDTLNAVRHAAAAGDIDRAANLIERTGGWELILFGGAGLMRALLAEVPANRLKAYPRVELFRAFLDAKEGTVIDARKRYEEAHATASQVSLPPTSTPLGRDLQVVGHLLARYEDQPVEVGALDALYLEINALDPQDALGRATLLNASCLVGFALGDIPDAHAACERAVREMRSLGSVLGLNYCALHLGLASFHLGRRREAEAAFREALELAEENFGADSGLRAVSDIHLAVAIQARGDIAGALELIHRSLEHIEAYDGWVDIYADGYRAAINAALSTGDLEQAETLLKRAAATASRRRLKRLNALIQAHRVRLYVRAGRLKEARTTINWRSGAWREAAANWREHHAMGIAAAELELTVGDPAAALAILQDLALSAESGRRARDALAVAFLSAVARFNGGASDDAASALAQLLGSALREDDTEFLIESGPLAAPLLHHARQWTRENGTSPLVRQALNTSLARLAALTPLSNGMRAPLLSGRELEVLAEVARHSSNKVIARVLQMTENTVKFHLKNIFQKLGIRHRAEAVVAAREQGLLP
jgi:LuxR family transcriptional regulator, maltose regulon positive regulatory protein